jgi:drug/metabolite transporter (DMT)-like permease
MVAVLASFATQLVLTIIGWTPSDFSMGAMLAFCAAGFFSAYLGRWLLFESVVKLGPARASTFLTSVPLFTGLFGWVMLDEHLSLNECLAMATTLGGLLLVSQPSSNQKNYFHLFSIGSWNLKLLGIGLGSSFAYAAGHVCRGYAIRSWNEPVLGVLIGAVTGLVLQILTGGNIRTLWGRLITSNRVGLATYTAIGLFGMIAQFLAIWAMLSLPTSKVALIMTATPLLIFPASWLFLKRFETINRVTVSGLFLTLLGIVYLILY